MKRVWERRVQTSRRERRTLSVFAFYLLLYFICICICTQYPSLGEPLLKRHLLRSMEYLAVGIHYKCSLANQTNFLQVYSNQSTMLEIRCRLGPPLTLPHAGSTVNLEQSNFFEPNLSCSHPTWQGRTSSGASELSQSVLRVGL